MNCDCDFCKLDFPIDLSSDCIDSLLKGEVVIFAGAGVSTEAKRVLKFTLYDEIAATLRAGKKKPPAFPEAMQRYVDMPNGRSKLIHKIKERFDHIDSFPELNYAATRFHREL